MRKKMMPVLIAVVLIILVIAGFMGIRLIEAYTPSKEMADINELLDVSGDQVALFLNDEKQDARGLYVGGQTYLPIAWVNSELNERFYWDESVKILVYTLPESIVYADHNTIGTTGKPLIWVSEEGVYLSLGLVSNYTDISLAAYDSGEVKRVYVNNTWNAVNKTEAVKAGKVRVKGGIKSPIITEVVKGEPLTVLEAMDKWVRVRTEDGYIGYIESRRLGELREEKLVSDFKAPVYTSVSMDEEICLVWHQVTRPEANDALEELLANTRGVNVISPTWFALSDNEGGYTSFASKSYVKKAHDMGLKVWALIDNFSKDVNTEILMGSIKNRTRLIESLMKDVETYGIDGLNLDFEGIRESAGVHYLQFIRELSVSCRKKGIVLSIDNYVPTASNRFYNRKEQGIVADYVIIMGYDEHYAGGDAGSVSSLGYVRDGIDNTLKEVPKEKVIGGIPFFTRVWTEGENETKSTAMGIAKAKQWIIDNKVEMYWQEELGQYYGEIDTEEGRKMIWQEDERSLELKMELIRDRQLAGVACWKLGFEPAEVWDVINPQ